MAELGIRQVTHPKTILRYTSHFEFCGDMSCSEPLLCSEFMVGGDQSEEIYIHH